MKSLIEEKRILRPFISSNLMRIIAIVLLMLGQTAAMLLLYGKVTFSQDMPVEELQQYKNLIVIAMPLLLTSIITNIVREPSKIKKYVLFYLVMAAVFAVAEIVFFYTTFVPFVEDIVKYALDVQGETTAEAHQISQFLLTYAMSNFTNMNVFLDLFLASLFAFFVLYTPKNASRKKTVCFRLGMIFPILYVLASFVVRGLFKRGYFLMNVEQSAFLVHRNYLCFAYFAGVVVYQKYRKTLYEKYNDYMSFDDYKRSTGGLCCYNAMLILFLMALCIVDYLFGLIPHASAFGVGKSYVLILSLPLIFLFNSERTAHKIATNVVSLCLYTGFGVIIFAGYAVILDQCLQYIGTVVSLIKAILGI